MNNITDLMPKPWRPYGKAIATVAAVFLAALGAAWPDGVTGAEWIAIALYTITGGGATYAARNDPA